MVNENSKIEDIIKNLLEKKETLIVCSTLSCKKIEIFLEDYPYWMSREEDPLIYDALIRHFGAISQSGNQGVVQGYCPECAKRVNEEFGLD